MTIEDIKISIIQDKLDNVTKPRYVSRDEVRWLLNHILELERKLRLAARELKSFDYTNEPIICRDTNDKV